VKIRNPYPFVHQFTDRHGRPRVYLRKPGHKRLRLPWPIGTREFVEAYQAALASFPEPIGQSRIKPGSINALVALYYNSPEWEALAPQSKRTYRNILERFREEHGDKPVALLRREHVKDMVAAKAGTPAAANKFRKLLLVLMRFAIDKGWRSDNPVATVRGLKAGQKASGRGVRTTLGSLRLTIPSALKPVWRSRFYSTAVKDVAMSLAWESSTSEMACLLSGSKRPALSLPFLFTRTCSNALIRLHANI
jgi:hypothetical protein